MGWNKKYTLIRALTRGGIFVAREKHDFANHYNFKIRYFRTVLFVPM